MVISLRDGAQPGLIHCRRHGVGRRRVALGHEGFGKGVRFEAAEAVGLLGEDREDLVRQTVDAAAGGFDLREGNGILAAGLHRVEFGVDRLQFLELADSGIAGLGLGDGGSVPDLAGELVVGADDEDGDTDDVERVLDAVDRNESPPQRRLRRVVLGGALFERSEPRFQYNDSVFEVGQIGQGSPLQQLGAMGSA